MEGKTASIAYRKSTGEFGPRKFLEHNKLFVIGTDTGSDIRLYKMPKFVRYVFELDEDGMVTLTDDTLPVDDTSRRRAFTSLRETFVVEGRTFSVEYLNSDEVAAATSSTNYLQTQRKQRNSSIPTFGGRNLREPLEEQFVTTRKPPIEYSDESTRGSQTPRRSSTSTESIVIPSPATPIPARSTPYIRRSVFHRQAMVTLAEEDESNSNDSKYKTPENTTPAPQIVMRSHKSSIKCKLDGESTPRCVTSSSNNKSRRSLLVCNESNTSDDESSEKGNMTITTTSTSDSEEENADSRNVNGADCHADDYNRQVNRQVAKRFRVDDEYDDELQVELLEPPKKRARRERTCSFREKSVADSRCVDSANISKNQLDTASFSCHADVSAPAQILPRSIITPSTLPRVNKRSHRSASFSQRSLSRRSMPSVSVLSNQENVSFRNMRGTFSASAPENGDPIDDNTTDSSSFTYVHGEEIDLGMSVFASEPSDTVRVFGNDLIQFSCRNTPLLDNEITPEKRQVELNSSTGRRSGRVIKPKMVYTPEQHTLPARTPKKTPAKRDIVKMESTTLINNSPISKSCVQTPTTDVPKSVQRRLSVNRTPKVVNTIATFDDDSLLSKSVSKQSYTPARINKEVASVDLADLSLTQKRKSFTHAPQHSLQINHCNTSLINDCVMTAKKSSRKVLSSAGDSFTEMRKNSPLTPRVVLKNTPSIKKSSCDHNKNSIKITQRTPKNTIAKSFDFEDSSADMRKMPNDANLIEDCSDSDAPVSKRTRTPGRTPMKLTANTESDDALIENKSTPYPRPNKKNLQLFPFFDDSLMFGTSPIAVDSKINKSRNQTPISDNTSTKAVDHTKSADLFRVSVLEQPAIRRSTRTSKSVFRANSTLDESIFDTSTKQSHSNRSMSDLTGKSMSRSLSMGDSLSRNTSKNSAAFDDSCAVLKSAPSKLSLRKRSASVCIVKQSDDSATKYDRGEEKMFSPMTDMRGIKRLFKTPKVAKEPKDDLTNVQGIKQLYGTPKLCKDPKNDLSDLSGVGKLMATPQMRNEAKRVKKSPKKHLADPMGVKTLVRTPKAQKQPLNSLDDLRGVKTLFGSPKQTREPLNDLSDFTGVKQLLKTPKKTKNDCIDFAGVKQLMTLPKKAKSPKNDLTNVGGVKKLMSTPKTIKRPIDDLTDVAGVKKIFQTPKYNKSYTADYTDISGVNSLFHMYEHSSDDDTTSTMEVPMKKTRARRGQVETIEAVYPPRQTRGRRAEPLADDLPLAKARATKKKVVPQEMEVAPEPSTTTRTRKVVSKPMNTEIEIVQKVSKRNTQRRVAVVVVEELAFQNEMQQIEEVSSAISTQSRPVTRNRGVYIQKVQESTEEDEPMLKKTRAKVTKSNQQTSPKKPRTRKTKITPNEEIVPDVVVVQKTRGRKTKNVPVLDEVDGDTIFESGDKAGGKAVRKTRARRGKAPSNQPEDLNDTESVDGATVVGVKKTRVAKGKLTKRVQFDTEDTPVDIKNNKRPKSRRLLSVEDVDSMADDLVVVRKSARSRK